MAYIDSLIERFYEGTCNLRFHLPTRRFERSSGNTSWTRLVFVGHRDSSSRTFRERLALRAVSIPKSSKAGCRCFPAIVAAIENIRGKTAGQLDELPGVSCFLAARKRISFNSANYRLPDRRCSQRKFEDADFDGDSCRDYQHVLRIRF